VRPANQETQDNKMQWPVWGPTISGEMHWRFLPTLTNPTQLGMLAGLTNILYNAGHEQFLPEAANLKYSFRPALANLSNQEVCERHA
jgi:hypothetical protein